MPVKPLELHPGAEEDYLNSLAWYRDRNFSTAERFEDAFWHAIHAVEDAPERWPVYFSHFRRYTLHQFPFSLVYCVETSRSFVLAVAMAVAGLLDGRRVILMHRDGQGL